MGVFIMGLRIMGLCILIHNGPFVMGLLIRVLLITGLLLFCSHNISFIKGITFL